MNIGPQIVLYGPRTDYDTHRSDEKQRRLEGRLRRRYDSRLYGPQRLIVVSFWLVFSNTTTLRRYPL
jgi:hypothetical protein